jgi:hypothetical protein
VEQELFTLPEHLSSPPFFNSITYDIITPFCFDGGSHFSLTSSLSVRTINSLRGADGTETTIIKIGLGLWYSKPLSTIFQFISYVILYHQQKEDHESLWNSLEKNGKSWNDNLVLIFLSYRNYNNMNLQINIKFPYCASPRVNTHQNRHPPFSLRIQCLLGYEIKQPPVFWGHFLMITWLTT